MTVAMVLGAGGWLGQRLIGRLISQNRKVICVDVRFPNSFVPNESIQIIKADIRDLSLFSDSLSNCVTVFNCCGLQHPKRTSDIYEVNASAPSKVYNACLTAHVKTFVHISSITAYGENTDGITFLDEFSPLSPTTHYGKSKSLGDLELQSNVRNDGTRLIILRPGVFYGEHPSRNLVEFLEKIQKNRMPIFSDSGFVRSYVDVEKVVDALLLSETRGQSGDAYLIADEEPLSTLRLYQVLAEQLQTNVKTVRVPLLISRMAEKAAWYSGSFGKHLRLPNIVGEFGRHSFALTTKAQNDLGFVPHKSPLPGLRKMALSYLNKN